MLKKLFYLLVVISLLIPVIGCNGNGTITTTSSSPPPTTTQVEYPFDFKLDLSPIPKLGETSELTFYVYLRSPFLLREGDSKEGLANGKIWLDFYWTDINGSYSEASHSVVIPSSEVLGNGGTSLQDDIRAVPKTIKCTIKLPQEGIWKIVGNVQGEGWQKPEAITKTYAIADGYAFGYGFTPNPELASSPLTYLMYFPYGQISYKNLDENHRIIQELDIAKAPLTGEIATVTVKITSLYDLADYTSVVKFAKSRGYELIAEENIVASGVTAWSGNLKAKEPVQYSFDIKFPEDGEWKIGIVGAIKDNPTGGGENIELTINKVRSYFGFRPLSVQNTPDAYRAVIDPYTGKVTIYDSKGVVQPEQSVPLTSPSPQSAPFNWIPIIITVPIIVIVGGVVAFLLIRQKRR